MFSISRIIPEVEIMPFLRGMPFLKNLLPFLIFNKRQKCMPLEAKGHYFQRPKGIPKG